MSNIYFSPEDLGLTVIDEIDRENQSYSFDSMIVWKDKDGYLYYAEDNGCSCPLPYENETIETIVRIINIEDFETHLKNWFHEMPNGIESDLHGFLRNIKDNFTK